MRQALLLTLSLFVLSATAATATTQPVLRVASTNPFVVKGQYFKSGERVVVRLIARATDEAQVRRSTASKQGSFVVDFGRVPIGHCLTVSVSAVGSGGSRALYKTHQLPACMPE